MTRRPHALVVGGTRGIGRAVVDRFRADGLHVSVVGRTPLRRPQPRVTSWVLDVRNPDDIEPLVADAVKRHGALSRLVLLQRFRGDGDAWQGEIETSLTASRRLIEAAVEHFAARSDRAIVAVSSIADRYIAEEQPVSYHVGKAGLTQLVRYYAVTLGPHRIRVNAVSSGTVVKREARAFYRTHPALRQLYESIIPLGRMGQAEEVAAAVSFLCGRDASFITGQALVVDGGVSLRWHESLARRVSPLRDLAVTRQKGGARR
jgi:NAD(P)-dependent dehydrogenase (short-subunit alcohol dehydrogenase family)